MDFIDHVKSVRKFERKEEHELLHGDDGGMVYKYDLPVVNSPITFHTSLVVVDDEKEALTQVEKLFDNLDCDKDTAYESFIIKFNQEFNHEVDMYGDIQKAGEVDLRVLDFGVPIPHQYLDNEEQMKFMRGMVRFNPDIPGAIELIHPNKFLAHLRPVDEFRHTPVIPISEKDMLEYKKNVEERNRKGYYVEIKKDTLYFYTVMLLTFGIIFYTFLLSNEKGMMARKDIERTRTLRFKAQRGREGIATLAERNKDDLEIGKTGF